VYFRSKRRDSGCVAARVGICGAKDVQVTLSGTEETPPVTTSAAGTGTIKVNKDKSVSGSIKTQGMAGTAAHIHTGASGESGPPIITLTQRPDGTWTVPAGSQLNDEQYASFKSGKLYVNVHSAEHKVGEIRAQLTKALSLLWNASRASGRPLSLRTKPSGARKPAAEACPWRIAILPQLT
jgi:hypothetical protein